MGATWHGRLGHISVSEKAVWAVGVWHVIASLRLLAVLPNSFVRNIPSIKTKHDYNLSFSLGTHSSVTLMLTLLSIEAESAEDGLPLSRELVESNFPLLAIPKDKDEVAVPLEFETLDRVLAVIEGESEPDPNHIPSYKLALSALGGPRSLKDFIAKWTELMTNPPVFNLKEISSHNTPDDCWVVLGRAVLDITPYLSRHPGKQTPVKHSGGVVDCLRVFELHHRSEKSKNLLKRFFIGILEPKETAPIGEATPDEEWLEVMREYLEPKRILASWTKM